MESLSSLHRPSAGVFHPCIWGDYFINHASPSSTELEQIQSRIYELKLSLSKMLKETNSHHQALVLIDTMQHLGVAYHFQTEIHVALKKLYTTGFSPSEDLQTIALGFRLLRQHGLHASSDAFSKFIDKDEDVLKLGLTHNAEALLDLYEASYLTTPDEKILEKLAYYARNHLELVAKDLDPYMTKMVSRALQLPRLKRVERLEARQFISIYELKQNRNKILLEFAKLDFQSIQSVHQEELRQLSLWKNKCVKPTIKFPFARDRLVELHFWMIGAYFESCYSHARIFATKILFLVSIIDDIYDQHGTPEELQLFTETINRWEVNENDGLPEYLKYLFLILDNTVKELQEEMKLEDNSFRIEYLKHEIKRLASAYHQESKWGSQSFTHTVEDYLNISMQTSVLPLLFCLSYVRIEQVQREVFDWVSTFPEVGKASSLISRLLNDFVSDEHEQKENHVANAVQCYVRQHGCTKEVAHKKLNDMVEKAWRIINQEVLRLSNIPLPFVWMIINQARTANLFYLSKDEYTITVGNMKEYIYSVMVETIISI